MALPPDDRGQRVSERGTHAEALLEALPLQGFGVI
jgi:hypothetical protein